MITQKWDNRVIHQVQTPLEELTVYVLNTVEEDGVKDEFTSNLNFLEYATVVNLHRTKSYLFDIKCTKIAVGWGSAPGPAGAAYSAPSDP